ncbi:MAG TPA: anti-sigma factor antagonist [Candidatus Aquilonibacter sp.]|nr:anti-sigma factor antagonist [Candidatus Aquilonibacter sp.]
MPLRMDSRPVGDVIVVRCDGRIVAGPEVQSLQFHLEKISPKHHDVVLQMERVEFVDSSGLGALVRLVSKAQAHGCDLKLCAVPSAVRKTLQLTNLLPLFRTYDTEAEAIVAAYLGSRFRDEAGEKRPRILCVYDSADVRALLGEVLCRAGYQAVTTGNVNDAKILLTATKAKLIVLGASLQSVYGASTKKAFEEIDPELAVIGLDENFGEQDPGEATAKLLEIIRSRTAGSAA